MSSLSVWEMSSGAGQGPNQAGLPQPQQNGSTLAQQMHSLTTGGAASGGGLRPLFTTEVEMIRARTYMQDKIFNILLQRQRQQPPLNEHERRKFKDVVKRLEEGLLRTAHSKEEYMNLETLESRLHGLITRSQSNSQSQQ